MQIKHLILSIFVLVLAACAKEKAILLSGVYNCDCTHTIHTPGYSSIGFNYNTSLEVYQSKTKLTIGDWTFSVRDLDQNNRFDEELKDGSIFEVEFDENTINFSSSVPDGESTSKTDCYGPKVD